MKTLPVSTAIIFLLLILSCSDNRQEKELKKLSAEKEKLLTATKDSLQKESEIEINPASVKADDYYKTDSLNETDEERILGCWFAPHSAGVNMKFYRNGKFEFNDYNVRLEKGELLTGNYELKEKTLILFYSDRPKQKFSFKRGEGADDDYYITNSSGYYLVKGTCE